MKVLQGIAFLGCNSARTKAYLQLLLRNGLKPSKVWIMSNHLNKLIDEADKYSELIRVEEENEQNEYFKLEEPVLYTLGQEHIPYTHLESENVNDETVYQAISGGNEKYVIYSGFGGQILRQPILSSGKKFLHVHPGIVPNYRGSTTFYYSLLKEGKVGASAIFLDEKIDCGPVLKTKWYELQLPVPNPDYLVDPYIRASLLVDVINEYLDRGEFEYRFQSSSEGETFYIIHPVLKHIALLSLEEEGGA